MSTNAQLQFNRNSSFETLPSGILEFWRDAAPTPMQQPEWMIPWWRAFASSNHELQIIHRGFHAPEFPPSTDQQSVLPLFSRRTWTFGNTLRFLASGSACSDFQSFLSSSPDDSQQLFSTILDSELNSWEVIEFEGHAEASPSVTQAVNVLSERGYQVQQTELENTWRLNLDDGFDGFIRNVSKTQRRQNRNLLNRFDGNHSLEFRVIEDPEKHSAALETLVELHQLRWKAADRSGCFSDQRFSQFIREATSNLFERNQCAIALLELDGKAVAAALCLKKASSNGDELYLYQTGRDPAHDSQRFGHLLCLLFLRWATEKQAAFVDYLRGDEIYKSRLGAVPSKCLRTRAFAPQLLPQLRHSALRIGKNLTGRSSAWRQLFNRP